MSEENLRRVVNLFRNWVRVGDKTSFFERVDAVTWFREPEFHPDYRRLYEFESELNGHPPTRFELLSIWRLAHDESYARWAKEVGTEACQIHFFGTQETNDWFFRRKGAFHDNLVATERLLEVGIRPRWELFFTKCILPELGGLLKLVHQMRLYERTEAIGGEFVIFLHTPAPDGEAFSIEHLRPTIEDLAMAPSELRECSERHPGRSIGEAENALVSRMLREEVAFPSAYSYPEELGFFVTSQFDVFSNIGDLKPWWKLGNLEKDSLDSIIDTFENNKAPGLHAIYNIPVSELAKRFGRRKGKCIYSPAELKIRWVRMWCQSLSAPNGSYDVA